MAAETNESIDIQISTLPWDQVVVDAFVCPTNSEGIMTQFPASKLRDLAGREVEDLAEVEVTGAHRGTVGQSIEMIGRFYHFDRRGTTDAGETHAFLYGPLVALGVGHTPRRIAAPIAQGVSE